MCRGIERDVLPTCRRHGIGVLVWSPLSGGWLTGKYQRSSPAPAGSRATTNPDHFDGDNDAKFDAAERLGLIAAEAGLTMTQLALAWSVEHPAVTAALIGPRTNDQLDDLLTAADVTLSADVLDAIDEVVPPGVDLNPADAGWTSPALAPSSRRRRRVVAG
jgi:aryl-alcohol dehydrogenase (NADP+)